MNSDNITIGQPPHDATHASEQHPTSTARSESSGNNERPSSPHRTNQNRRRNTETPEGDVESCAADAALAENHGAGSIKAAVGAELRRARDTLGWTRAELIERLPFDIHPQTLAGYERGAVHCTVGRFIDMCSVMGVSAPDILACAMQRAEIDLDITGVQVDLRAVISNSTPALLPLRRWARARLKTELSRDGVAHLTWPTVQEMATLFGLDRTRFARTLGEFTPRPVPQRR